MADYTSIGESPVPSDMPPDENLQRRRDYATWLLDNKDKAGTPEFVTVAEAYRKVSDKTEAPLVQNPLMQEVGNAIMRMGTRLVTAPWDIPAAISNAGLNPFEPEVMRTLREKKEARGEKMFPEAGNAALNAMGVPLEAATPGQRFAEAVGTAAIPAGPGIVRAVAQAPTVAKAVLAGAGSAIRNAVAPVVGGEVGGEVGGQMFGEKGRLIGGLAAGMGAPMALGAPRSILSRYDPVQYAGTQAGEVAAAAQRQGAPGQGPMPVTFGSLANKEGQRLERTMMPKSEAVQAQSDLMLGGMVDAGKRLVENRQALPVRTAENAEIVDVAARARAAGADASQAAQQHLAARIGPQNPVDVSDTINTMRALANQMDRGDWNRQVAPRLKDLEAMRMQGATGPLPFVTYEQFKNWRTNLRLDLGDMPRMDSRYVGTVYDPATQAMKKTAVAAGVKAEAFDAAMDITRSQSAAQDLTEMLRTSLNRDSAAGPRGLADRIDNLTANDKAELARLGGNNVQDLQDLAMLARRWDYGSDKGGGYRAFTRAGERYGPAFLTYGALRPVIGDVGATVAAGAVGKILPDIQGRLLQSKWAQNRMANPPPPSMTTGKTSFDRILEQMARLQGANEGLQ